MNQQKKKSKVGNCETRLCTMCKVTKPISEYVRKRGSNPPSTCLQCRECRNGRWRQYYKNKFKGDSIYHRQRNLRVKYGITPISYDQLLEKQEGKCAICDTKDPKDRWNRFVIDHKHNTKNVRGLLCTKCNAGIGMFDEDTDKLESAIRYLKMQVRDLNELHERTEN